MFPYLLELNKWPSGHLVKLILTSWHFLCTSAVIAGLTRNPPSPAVIAGLTRNPTSPAVIAGLTRNPSKHSNLSGIEHVVIPNEENINLLCRRLVIEALAESARRR